MAPQKSASRRLYLRSPRSPFLDRFRMADERVLRRAIRLGGLSCDQFKPFRTGAFLQRLEPSACRSRIPGLEFNVAEREGGFELQSKEAQVTCPRECLLSGFLGFTEVLPGRHN